MQIDIRTLLSKLNSYCKNALTLSAEQCVQLSHFNVEPEHLIFQLTQSHLCTPDLQIIFDRFNIKLEPINKQVRLSLERFKRGNSRTPSLSSHFTILFQESWLLSSILLGEQQVRSGTLLSAFLEVDSLRGLLIESAPGLLDIPRERLKAELSDLLKNSDENLISSRDTDIYVHASQSNASQIKSTDKNVQIDLQDNTLAAQVPQMPNAVNNAITSASKSPSLDQYTIDFTMLAKSGRIDPIKGRDAEIRQIIDILLRRRQNNPILTGEAGVGKTAVVEGFAQRIVEGKVPPALRGIRILALDLALLQAGAGMRGEFENRLKSVISEVRSSPTPVILFIDEAHQLIGAGGSEGQNDAANLLKPALARGELRTIAATTWVEYKKYVERDPALVRRFQVVKIDEPTPEVAIEMLRGIVKTLEDHHKVEILDEAVKDAVRLSHRYITGRQLPDKAISILDTACARVCIGQTGSPPQIEALEHALNLQQERLRILQLSQSLGAMDELNLNEIDSLEIEVMHTKDDLKRLRDKLNHERKVVQEITAIRRKIIESIDNFESQSDLQELRSSQTAQLIRLQKGLEAIQEDAPLVPVCVDSSIVANVISSWTGIPVGKMMSDDIHTVMNLKDKLSQRIVGQDEALEMIVKRIRTFRAELDDPSKPVGVFVLVGPSGVGKTETAFALADMLYGGERNMITINMSEFQEAHSISNLKGAPPGYVGYGSGGLLTEAVRRRPYSVILLDEMEKAHPDVLELFFQVFDKGTMEDGEGVTVDFKNTLILLTSNAAQEVITQACEGHIRPSPEELMQKLRPVLLKQFSSAFLARLVIVPFYPLINTMILEIVQLKLNKLAQRFKENHNAEFSWSDEVTANISARCTEVDSGARNIDFILTQTILPQLSSQVLEQMSLVKPFNTVFMDVSQQGQFEYRFSNKNNGIPIENIATNLTNKLTRNSQHMQKNCEPERFAK